MDVETTKRRQVASAQLAARGPSIILFKYCMEIKPPKRMLRLSTARMSASPRVGWQ